jgi:hypothetical protein
MNSLALSPQEVAVLHAARKPATKSVLVHSSVAMVSNALFDAPLARLAVDRMYQNRYLTKDAQGRYILTENGHRAVSEALSALDRFLSFVRYGVRS